MVQDKIHLITVDREIEVLRWLLEGKSLRWIGMHMGLSDRHIGRIKDTVIRKMSHISDTSEKCRTCIHIDILKGRSGSWVVCGLNYADVPVTYEW